MNKLEDQYIELMKRNRDLRMRLLMLVQDLDQQEEPLNPHEIADKLIELLHRE